MLVRGGVVSGDAGGGYRYPDDASEAAPPERPVPRLTRHSDHDPGLICRPAFGRGLCEVLEPRDDDGDDPGSERAPEG